MKPRFCAVISPEQRGPVDQYDGFFYAHKVLPYSIPISGVCYTKHLACHCAIAQGGTGFLTFC